MTSRITKGSELATFITGLNGGAPIDTTLLDVLVDSSKNVLEDERPWMALRKTDSSLSLTTSNTWQTAKSLAGITDFSRIHGDGYITLYGPNGEMHYYYQRPADRKLEYKDDNSAFWYDVNSGALHFGGTPPFNGTLYLPYIATAPAIDLASSVAITDVFLLRVLKLLGFYAIGIHKGAVDYDAINKLMLPENRTALNMLKAGVEKWDDQLQESEIVNNDPTELHNYPRSHAIDRS